MATSPCRSCGHPMEDGRLVDQRVLEGFCGWRGSRRVLMCPECAGRVQETDELKALTAAVAVILACALYVGLGWAPRVRSLARPAQA